MRRIFLPLLLCVIIACSKEIIEDRPKEEVETEKPEDPKNTTTETATNTKDTITQTNHLPNDCNLIAYSDTVYFLKNQKDDVKIKPLIERKGTYGGYPEGLEINHSNGEINLTKSGTGYWYDVYFVPDKTIDTCFTRLFISGIDYTSKIYYLDKNDKVAIPIYNENPALVIPGVNNANSKTEFDDGPDDDDNDGTDDEPLPGEEVIPQGLAISKKDGKIDLDATVKNAVFGNTPKNGSSKKFKIYYRLDDNSGASVNKIEIEVHYFDTDGDVPQNLKDKINANNKGKVMRLLRKPRPPLIVIVNRK